MFTSIEEIPSDELAGRRKRCLGLMRRHCPDAGGIMAFSGVNIYYLTGVFAQGVFWLPLEGEPLLLLRKGLARAALENPRLRTACYKSYSQVPALLTEQGSPLTPCFALERDALNWGLGLNFSRYFQAYEYLPGDMVFKQARAVKTPWELLKMRLAGQRHHLAMCGLFPERARLNMNGYQLSRLFWDIFFELGHSGAIRTSALGEDSFLGHLAVGENSAYPSYYNRPTGLKGVHPAASYMGYAGEVWTAGSFLTADVGFVLEGYNTDKTMLYFAGPPSVVPAQARLAQDCCLEIQHEVSARLKPGAIPQDLYRLALDLASQRGFSEGFMGLGDNKVPFIGHGLGLQLDEWPVLADNFTEPLEE
ncbi:MAG: aminopeptidase P family protein, partial [Deltaproteobacteria bacterium]|nr:aminopeptidase P family protein [Deltaproteobacteria bacterium]